MRLAQLLRDVDSIEVHGPSDVEVHRITRDSREAGAGVIWVAIRGAQFDGHRVVSTVSAGVVVVEEPLEVARGVTRIVVPDTRRALAQLASALHDYPSHGLKVVGITGTNGKTTVSTLCAEAMEALGLAAGRIGTLGANWNGGSVQTGLTTPEPPALHGIMAQMKTRGTEAVFVEVSSIALDQRRVEALPFHTVVFTNLSRDHLDFHGTMEAYATSKAQLFEDARLRAPGGLPRAILCGDDPAWRSMDPPDDRWLYGFSPGCDLHIRAVTPTDGGQDVEVALPGDEVVTIRSRLVGEFNALNQVAALASLFAVGVSWSQAAEGLGQVAAVPGRLEWVANPNGVWVYVDYAHTPDALGLALRAIRPITSGKVWVVFGCGGDRDAGKRPEMGAVAATEADVVVVTSDNPRSESPQQIVDQIIAGVDVDLGERVRTELDRRAAIALALREANRGDVVLIAGKGHETTQEIMGTKHPFDDREVAREVA